MDPSTATIDPTTGLPLPPDAIVRVLHITSKVHIYSIPPTTISTTAGYAAASWTASPRNHIFTARLRVLETSIPSPSTTTTNPSPSSDPASDDDSESTLSVSILLEDPSTGSLFAAAPYTNPATVEPTTDSSRFFAVRVQDPAGKQKATLGVGFEERSEAFDFGVALQEAGRALGFSNNSNGGQGQGQQGGGGGGNLMHQGQQGQGEEVKRDLSLKEGETITVNLKGTRFGRRGAEGEKKEESGRSLASFALPPPPGPTTSTSRAAKRLSAQQLGFDDGKFGEFA